MNFKHRNGYRLAGDEIVIEMEDGHTVQTMHPANPRSDRELAQEDAGILRSEVSHVQNLYDDLRRALRNSQSHHG